MKTFEDILMEKMGTEPVRQKVHPVELDPAGLSFLLGQVGRFEFKSNAKYRVQPKPASESKASFRQEFDLKTRAPGPAHKLSEKEQTSFYFFSVSSVPLQADFTGDELKSSFRKLAMIFHPDRGGEKATFILLKFHYDTLKKVFTE